MSEGYKIYSTQDFIRKDEKGELDFQRSLKIIREVLTATGFHKDHNVLLDLRETETKVNFVELLTLSMEFAKYKGMFKNKLACLIPNQKERVERAEYVKNNLAGLEGFQLEYFTEYEKAIDWLSIIEDRK